MHVTAVIPARFASTRLPGKPLADLLGKPMIQWVYEKARSAGVLDRVIVATDDERIYRTVLDFGGEAQMTCPDHSTGTDRLAEVASRLETDLVVNVQGDEPLIEPAMIEEAVAPLVEDAGIPMGTLMTSIASMEELLNPNVVKVVVDRSGFALYFSRSPIPHQRDAIPENYEKAPLRRAFKHIGLYVYRREFLLRFSLLEPTPLENFEKLEQLRALEHGFRIRVVETSFPSQGVDTPEDLERARRILESRGG